jgi:hypothetical protein
MPFVGRWQNHGYTLTIRADGTGDVVGFNFVDTHQPAGAPDYREQAAFSFSASSDGIVAHVDTAYTPNPPGSAFASDWYTAGDSVPLRMDAVPYVVDLGYRHFCPASPDKPWSAALCGE